jgi:hypothetical protein
MRKSSEIRKAIAEATGKVEAIVELATVENRELSDDEKKTVDQIQGLGDEPGEIHNLEQEYEVEKKDDQIKLLSTEKELEETRKKTILIVSIIVGISLILLSYFLRKKINLQADSW